MPGDQGKNKKPKFQKLKFALNNRGHGGDEICPPKKSTSEKPQKKKKKKLDLGNRMGMMGTR